MQNKKNDQAGVAAIELSLVLGILLLIFAGLISFSLLFLAQQRVSHYVGDIARESRMNPLLQQAAQSDTNEQIKNHLLALTRQDAVFAMIGGEPTLTMQDEQCNGAPCRRFTLSLPVNNIFFQQLLALVLSDQAGNSVSALTAEAAVILTEGDT